MEVRKKSLYENNVSGAVVVVSKEHFDLVAFTYDARASRGLWGLLKLKEITSVLQQIGQPEKVLDLGCGTGMYAEKIREIVPHCKIFGLDKSATMLQKLEERGFSGKCVDFEKGAFFQGKFDVILGLGVLEFVRDLGFVRDTLKMSSGIGTRVFVLIPRWNILNVFYYFYHRLQGNEIKLRRTREYKKIFFEDRFELKAEFQVTPVSRLLIFQKF